MTARSRTTNFGSTCGTRTVISSGAVTTNCVSNGYSKCDDTINDFGGLHGLQITHRRHVAGTVSGKALAFPVYIFDRFPYSGQAGDFSHLVQSIPSTAEAVTQVIALTNPSLPYVSVPNFLFELKDLPGMLLNRGRELIKAKKNPYKTGNSVAEVNFGWLSLGRDLFAILDFGREVDLRVAQLRNSYRSGGSRVSRTIWSGGVTSQSNTQTFHSTEGSVQGYFKYSTYTKVWATCRWIPDNPTLPSASDLLSTARRTVHGWDFSAGGIGSALWEALPWSWLSDYFFNVGTFLNASRNTVGITPHNPCRMVHSISSKQQIITFCSSYFKASPSSATYETKDRYVGSPSITLLASQPFLTAQRLTTLLGIANNFG